MSNEKTEGVIIRLADFSESSKVVTWFTRDFGKTASLAKGAKRLKSSFEAAIDLLATCRIVFIRKSSGGLDILTEAQLVNRFRPYPGNLSHLYVGYYIAELLDALTEEYDPHPELYDAVCDTLQHLQEHDDFQKALIKFELTILEEIGQLPQFEYCAGCNGELGPAESYLYDAHNGGVYCRDCEQQRHGNVRVSRGTISVLQKLSTENTLLSQRLNLSLQQQREIRHLLSTTMSHILGRRPKMASYLKL
ncbi:DNA repair protein RecO [Gimesia panareensis]|uniref:DNA repair protein RecO n=1 Tax=Gimesia panareensis TaxID=2527978 RepID=A0A517QE05_9PLAN|nr:DNA repair protein RecO [Gimesia panareensis]QDT29834.1 DNA repair protein RecO [Gimesia panareensis]